MKQKTFSQHNAQLAQINQKIIADGQSLPAVMLKDGSSVQTGTVAALLHNIKLYDAGAREEVEAELEMAIPTLFKVGLFDLFTPEEWLSGSSPGRCYVGKKAQEFSRN